VDRPDRELRKEALQAEIERLQVEIRRAHERLESCSDDRADFATDAERRFARTAALLAVLALGAAMVLVLARS
jgi:hypothetical protein